MEESEPNGPEEQEVHETDTLIAPTEPQGPEIACVCSLEEEEKALSGWPGLSLMSKELVEQQRMGGPLAVNLFFVYCIQIVTMSFLGHCGEVPLAAASLAMVACNTMGTLFIMGLCGATMTLASQAFGAGQYELMAVIFQRTVLFLAAHMAPVTGIVLSIPALCRWMGQPAEVCELMMPYVLISLPGLWLDTVDRPMNRMLVAQSITRPQMWISGFVLVLHYATNYVFFNILGWSYLAAALAFTLSRFYYFILQALYIHRQGLGYRVWGTPSRKALSDWKKFAALAYPSAAMRCMESVCYAGMTVMAGILQNGATAVAAIGLAFNIYGTLFMAFLGVAVAVSTRVGNSLGAKRPGSARLSAFTAISVTPMIWLPLALVLTLPYTQSKLVGIFVQPVDARLWKTLSGLLNIVAILELFDGLQTVMSGVVTGTGKQLSGALIVFVAFYIFAVPLALCLGFLTPMWVYGLYLGLAVGPLVQAVLYMRLIWRINWRREAENASART